MRKLVGHAGAGFVQLSWQQSSLQIQESEGAVKSITRAAECRGSMEGMTSSEKPESTYRTAALKILVRYWAESVLKLQTVQPANRRRLPLGADVCQRLLQMAAAWQCSCKLHGVSWVFSGYCQQTKSCTTRCYIHSAVLAASDEPSHSFLPTLTSMIPACSLSIVLPDGSRTGLANIAKDQGLGTRLT